MIVIVFKHIVTGQIVLYEEGTMPKIGVEDSSVDGESYWEELGEYVLQEWREFDDE